MKRFIKWLCGLQPGPGQWHTATSKAVEGDRKTMKTLLTLTIIALLCGCANEHTLVVRDWDPKNNRVDEKGNLLPWTNWQAGFVVGTNWIKVFQSVEP